jgi:aerotaxis receptor
MQKPVPVDEEFSFEGRAIVSETDTKGIITFVNRKFCEISGYSVQELLGQPHNIVRHPDMPKVIFTEMWKTLQAGITAHAVIKNLRKDGKFYWMDTQVSPVYNDDNSLVGYIAARKPVASKNIQETVEAYQKLLDQEN